MLALSVLSSGIFSNDVVPASSDNSIIFTVNITANVTGGDYNTFLYYGNDPATYTEYIWIGQGTSGLIEFYVTDVTDLTIPNPGLGCHIFFYVREGNDHKLYIDGKLVSTLTKDISGQTFTDVYVGSDQGVLSVPLGQYQYYTEWEAAYGVEALITEANDETVSHPDDLFRHTPLVDDLLDDSGNNYDWSNYLTGQTFIDGPVPIDYNNKTSLTAREFFDPLPAWFIQIPIETGIVGDSWFTYDFIATTYNQLGAFYFESSSLYTATIQPFRGPASLPVSILGIGGNKVPIQFPVVVGNTYLIKIATTTPSAGQALFTLKVYYGPNEASNQGDILVPDDTHGFPAVIISPTEERVLKTVYPFASGEEGDVLPIGGKVLVTDNFEENLKFYDNQLNLLDIIHLWGAREPLVRTCQALNKFLIGLTGLGATKTTFQVIDSNGDVEAPVYGPLPGAGLSACGLRNDGGIIYYSGNAGSTDSSISRWNTVTNLFVDVIVSAVTNYSLTDMLVLGDDTIVALYFRSSNHSCIVKTYDSIGTLLNTFDYGTGFQSVTPKLAYGIDDPDTFWVWLHLTSPQGTSRFKHVQTSDGTVLEDVDIIEFENGTYQGASSVDPPILFGPSFSCPFLILREDIGDITLTVTKVTVPPSDTTSFDITAGGGLDPSSISLANGESQVYTGIGPGTYSIVEDAVEGYTTTYEVSNGDPNNAIDLVPGDSVTVTITNTNTANPDATGSGIYKLVPGKRFDTLWVDASEGDTVDVKIPDPFFKSGAVGK